MNISQMLLQLTENMKTMIVHKFAFFTTGNTF